MGALNRTVVAPLSSAIIAVLLAGIVVVGFDGVDRNLREGEARLQTTGVVEVAVDGAPFARASRDRLLGHNDQIRVVEGKAVLELPRSSPVELRDGSVVTLADGREAALILDQGDLLVEAPNETIRIESRIAVASVAGSARLRRGVSLLAGVYEGNVNLEKNGRSLGVPQYRQAAAVGTGLLPEAPDPLDLRASDEWDRRLLGEVLSLSEQLEIFGRSFEAQLPAEGAKGPELFKSVIPELAGAPIAPQLLTGRAPGENLIGLTLVALDRGDFDVRMKRVFGFRSAGASWGLVAADRDLNPNPVLVKLESAIERILPRPAGTTRSSGTASGAPGAPGGSGTGSGSQIPGDELAAGLLGPTSTQPTSTTSPSSKPGGSGGTNPSNPGNPNPSNPANPSPPSTPPSSPPPSKKKTVDLPSTGTVLDPVLEPVVTPLENLLSGVLDNLTEKPAPSGSTPVTSPATTAPTTTTTTAPAPTTTTAPSGGRVGGLFGTLGGLLNAVGGLLG